MRRVLYCLVAAAAIASSAVSAAPAPVADHHQHLFSYAIVKLLGPEAGIKPLAASELVLLLDAAGIERAVLLSTAYMYGSPRRQVADEYAQVRAENDWTAAQAARFPQRLVAFCGIAPLKAYALDEIVRCASRRGLIRGIKLHLGNGDVQLDQPQHVQRLAEVFAAANRAGMAIVVHMRASIRNKRPYGADEARAFLDKVLPAAPDVPVQLAHLGGTGPGFDDPPAREVLATLAEAVERRHPATRKLWFDVASIVQPGITPEDAALLARRLRQIGLDRVLYGTDSAQGDNLRPREAWAAFQRLPLSEKEFAQVAGNVAPYLAPAEKRPAAGTK